MQNTGLSGRCRQSGHRVVKQRFGFLRWRDSSGLTVLRIESSPFSLLAVLSARLSLRHSGVEMSAEARRAELATPRFAIP